MGVNISYHIPKEVTSIIQTRLSEFADKPSQRLKAIMRRLGEKLKSDPSVRNGQSVNLYLDEEFKKLKESNEIFEV